MKLILYYMTRTVKNQIRKIFRTWVAVFLLVCLVFGLLCGLGAAALSSLFEEDTPDEEYTEVAPEDEIILTEEEQNALIELVAGGVVLAVLVFSAFLADKSGGSIFLMADVNLLFAAPMKPQSVLLFRLIMQAGTSIIATVYLLFQIPNLIFNMGLGVGVCFAMLGAWFLLMIYAKLLSVLLYTLSATYPRVKRLLRPTLFAVLFLIGGGFLLAARGATNYFTAALAYFNAPVTRYIPVWGWLKGFVLFAATGNVGGTLLTLAALLITAVLLVLVIWRIKADFYEDAMARSEETAAMQQAANEGKQQMKQRKKDRGERLSRDGLSRGAGASVYFHKAMYNRFRFAHLRVFTKTSETYLLVAAGLCLLLWRTASMHLFAVVPLVLGGISFFRSLGNPIHDDVDKETFFLVPDTAHRKVFFTFAAGVLNAALDLLPAFLVAALVLRPDPLSALVWFLVVISLGAYSDSMGLFIDLSLSTGLSQTVKSLVQILFIYFGLIPAAVLIVLGFAFDRLLLFALLTVLFNLAIVALSLTVSPLFVENGRK